jgi:tetratricopeptide (TPR) repeat protein
VSPPPATVASGGRGRLWCYSPRCLPAVTCIRCFAIFDSEDARPGTAPVCAACAPAAGAPREPLLPPAPAARTPGRSGGLRRIALAGAILVLLAGLGLGAAHGLRLLLRRSGRPHAAAQAPVRRASDEAVAHWRATGKLPVAPALAATPRAAEERVAAGRAALAADQPSRIEEALVDFREALAAAPESADAAAGYGIALAEGGLDTLQGADIARAHDLLQEAMARHKDHPRLLAAFARLLVAVPSAKNLAQAREVAARARTASPGDPDAELALGLAELASDPAAAARDLAAAAQGAPGDLRLLTAAARARWLAGDAAGALELARARLAKDPGHPRSLALLAEIGIAVDRVEEARTALDRWAAASPAAAEPLLIQAQLRHQVDRDLPAARRLLAAALERQPDDFLAARILAHSAALEREAGDLPAARDAVAEALRRVPASGPAQYQAALLAFEARDVKAFKAAAGTVGERGGPAVAAQLGARRAELSGELEEAQRTYQALAAQEGGDASALLAVGGALLRQRAPGAALDAARKALAHDLADARLRRTPTDYWEGPGPLQSAAVAFQELGRSDARNGGAALAAAAACELLLGHTRQAEALARASQAADAQSAAPLWLRAQLALDLGQPARALPLAQAAVELEEADAAAQAVLGRALEAAGMQADAERAYRAALAVAPDLVVVRLALARSLARRGEAEAGRALLVAVRHDAPDAVAVRRALLDLGEGAPTASP